MAEPLFRAIDCVQVPVPDLDDAIAFYGDRLGHRLVWRSAEAAGFAFADQDGSEIVVQVTRPDSETDLLVHDVDEAIRLWTASGGSVEVPAFDIEIGRCAVLRDPFGNRLVILDMSRGPIGAPTAS